MVKSTRPLDRSPYYVDHFEHLDRVLNRPQLTGIGVSGCIGVGIFVTSGQLITTSGSLGGALAYLIAGIIAASVLYTLTEMVASRPLTGALIDLPHHFLDPAAGFAVAVSYSLANIFSMATLTAYSAEVTALMKDHPTKHSNGLLVGINIALIGLTTLTHCLGVKLYGKIERVIMVFKLCLFILCCILMIVVNAGGAGTRTGSYRSNYTTNAFPPGFKPLGFNSTVEHSIHTRNTPDTELGIPGSSGRLFGFLTTVTFAIFSCLGGEMTAMTAGESKEPWKDVPVVMSFVYLIPLTLYPFVLMSAAANVNYADPALPIIWEATSEDGTIALSPFVVAIQTTSLMGASKMLNLFFIISAYTAGNTALYVASRSVFMLAQTYLPSRAANIFGHTNNGHTPLASILFCSLFGFVALAGLGENAGGQTRQTLSAFYTGTIASVYVCQCVTFLKFRAGLKRLELRKILSRNDELYISRMFKSRWQPLPAYIGIAGCLFVIIWSGVPAIWILGSRSANGGNGVNPGARKLKSNGALACDILGAWIGPLIFMTLYLVYKYIAPGSIAVDVRDLTPSDYVLADLSLMEGENAKSREDFSSPVPPSPRAQPYSSLPSATGGTSATNRQTPSENRTNLNRDSDVDIELQAAGTDAGLGLNLNLTPMSTNDYNHGHSRTRNSFNAFSPPPDGDVPNYFSARPPRTFAAVNMDTVAGMEMEISAELMEEIEAQRAREEERARINAVLEKRPRRMQRGIARELWSCLVAD